LGNHHTRTFKELSDLHQHIQPNFLLQLSNQTLNLLDERLQFNISNSNTLLGSGQFSILQDLQQTLPTKSKSSNYDALPRDFYLANYAQNRNNFNFSGRQSHGQAGTNLILNLNKQQLNGQLNTNSLLQPELFKSMSLHKRSLVHLSQVYCVCFDRTGKYVLTGADDKLIKCFSTRDGRLVATFRGHEKEISDIEINFENTLLASGSCDK
jgi:WD40 repeat protein